MNVGAGRRVTIYVRCWSCPWYGRRARGEDCSCVAEWGVDCRCAFRSCPKCKGKVVPGSEQHERRTA